MSDRLAGRSALITGAATGIGRAVVRAFLAEGCRVAALDRSESGLALLQSELGPGLAITVGDVRDPGAHRRALESAVGSFGGLDILVPNAGVFDGMLHLDQLPEEALVAAFDEIFAINVKGYLLAVHAALPALRKNRGCIVFTASTASLHAGRGGPLYTASKHAVLGLTRQLAYELAPEVRVNAVAPGGTLTDLAAASSLAGLWNPIDPEARRGLIQDRNPLHIAQSPEDHVGAYVLLASEQSRAMTGSVIESDGGIGVRG